LSEEKYRFYERIIRIVLHSIVSIFAIWKLTDYGIHLADMGIDNTIAMTIGVLVGALGGVSFQQIVQAIFYRRQEYYRRKYR